LEYQIPIGELKRELGAVYSARIATEDTDKEILKHVTRGLHYALREFFLVKARPKKGQHEFGHELGVKNDRGAFAAALLKQRCDTEYLLAEFHSVRNEIHFGLPKGEKNGVRALAMAFREVIANKPQEFCVDGHVCPHSLHLKFRSRILISLVVLMKLIEESFIFRKRQTFKEFGYP
jgi:hypothetical protein